MRQNDRNNEFRLFCNAILSEKVDFSAKKIINTYQNDIQSIILPSTSGQDRLGGQTPGI